MGTHKTKLWAIAERVTTTAETTTDRLVRKGETNCTNLTQSQHGIVPDGYGDRKCLAFRFSPIAAPLSQETMLT